MEFDFETNLKMDVVKGAKAIFHKGLVDVGEGNVSIRVPEKEELLITPSFNQYETMTQDDVVHLRFDGKQLSQGKQASSEYRLHVAIYNARPKVQCVIHTHSPYATMLSIVRRKIPILMEEMAVLLGGAVNISKFGLAHTADMGGKALKALGTTNATLLANHGVLACGRTMEHTVKIAELVEKMAMIYLGALQIGKPKAIPERACLRFMRDFDLNFSTHSKTRAKM